MANLVSCSRLYLDVLLIRIFTFFLKRRKARLLRMSSKKASCVCLSAPVFLIKQGLGDEPGLGEELYKYMGKGGEKPDV